jgi:hypothetical protein
LKALKLCAGIDTGAPEEGEAAQPKPFPRAYNPKHTSADSASFDVFISHPGTVKNNIVAWLNQSLWSAGVKSFLDKDGLKLGCDANSVMEEEASTAQIVICVLIPDFFIRKWTLQELHWALENMDRKPTAKVYPIFYGVSPNDDKIMIDSMQRWLQSENLETDQCTANVTRLFRITGDPVNHRWDTFLAPLCPQVRPRYLLSSRCCLELQRSKIADHP